MSLIFQSDAAKLHPEQPATHVLLVGCGDYPNLGAAGYPGRPPLTSPRLSVKAMSDWFLGGPDGRAPAPGLPSDEAFYNPAAPLGSVELLASPAYDYITPAGEARQIDRPSLPNIRDAYKRWLSRVNTNVDSCGVFYFCGHGVGDGVDQVLIADDFGDDPGDVWSATFHVSNTCQASIRKTSANLLFLIDACMEFNPDVLFQIDTPKGLVPGAKNGTPLCSDWLVMRASTTNRLAYAEPNDMARFTKALLQALKGHCGMQRAGQPLFDVTASQLRNGTAAFLALLQQPGDAKWQKIGTPQGEGAWNIPLHVLTKRPTALVQLDVDPAGYRPIAQAFMEKAGTPRELQTFNGGPAQFKAEWGEWSYGVNALGGNAFHEQVLANQLLFQSVLPYSFTIP
ncbi:caspase family protein [Cupriavidus basilensis]|uniref:caspase family protein n=1 Tax=Cupriavidus basilensis TaxID=68895 RepID=UPI00157B4AAF|nr:caspase family protein [Cupriavidus basilensis]NUA26318.1 caspase family protein [Cupriavidus basilensis]